MTNEEFQAHHKKIARMHSKFADALKDAIEERGFHTVAAVARAVGCSLYTVDTWLGKYPQFPGGRHGPRVLELFGLDSRDYGGNWKRGFGGNFKNG